MANIISEIRGFKGVGMNSDDAIDEVGADLVSSFNLILTGNVEGEAGNGTNLASTIEILGYDLPAGINKCIGAERFENERIILAFIYNSFGYHQFFEYNYDTDLKTLLYTNLTDSAGIDVLPLTSLNFINDIKLIDNIVIFTDGNIPIGYIDKEMLKEGAYGVLTANDWNLNKPQPLAVAKVSYGDDSGRVVNLFKNKLFQYNYNYGYSNNERSADSTWSKRQVPTKESTTSVGEDVTKNNNQTVTVNIGSNRVTDLNIHARYSLYDYFLIKSVERSYIVGLTNTAIDIDNEVYEAYNPAMNEYSFVFYNDGSYNNISPIQTDHIADIVPKAETLEFTTAGVLVVGGLTEGYERPVVPVRITVSDYDPQLQTAPFDPDPLRITSMFDTDPPGQIHKRRIHVYFDGIVKTGDKIRIIVSDFRDATVTRQYDYTVPSMYNTNTLGALQDFATQMPLVAASAFVDGTGFKLTWIDLPYYSAAGGSSAVVTLASVGSGLLSSIHALKSNSAYQAALQTYDRFGTPLPTITGTEYIFKTNSYAQSQGLTPRMSWNILGNFPTEVASFQWLLSENTTHQTTLYVNSKYLRTDGDYMVLSINPLKIFNERNSSSILNYEYSEGDRATFMYFDDAGTKNYFNDPYIDVQVVGFDIVIDTVPNPDTITYELKVKQNSSIDTTVISGKNIYIEIYTPKKRVVTEGGDTTYLTNLFYEVGEQYPVVNGVPSVTSGVITDGDIYFQTRDYVSAVDEATYSTYLADDFNFSPLYKSNYTSYGRAFAYNERDGIKIRKAGIRYSDVFVIDTKTNGLNRFYAERLYGDNEGETSSVYGWIRKLRQRDNYLVCIQEVKEGHIPVYASIKESQTGQRESFLSDKFLNNVLYSQTGSYGMGNAPESFSESPKGVMSFADPNNSVPMSDGYNGLVSLAGKMSKFFKGLFQKAKQEKRPIISYWDNYTEQRVFSVQDDEDILVQVPFDSGSLIYLDDYTVNTNDITITVQPTSATVTLISGEWTITPNTGYTGSQSFKFSFPTPSGTVEKNGCFTVVAGDGTPVQFYFMDVVDQNVSTDVFSNLIPVDGINIPVAVSITGGQYSKNGGSYTGSAGTVVQNDVIQVKLTTSASVGVTTNATLTIGGVSDTFSATTAAASVPNTEQKQTLQRNNCSAGSSGTFYEYVVPAGTYFAADLTTANNMALADIAANGQNAANTNGSCLLDSVLSIFVIDIQTDTGCNVCMYIDTAGVAESNNIVAVAQNFYETTDTPENAYMLASDNIAGFTTRRFELNIGKLINQYPNDVAVPQFVYRLRGRTVAAGTMNGVYALKYPTQRMTMTGSAGSYIPSITPAGGPVPTAWSGSIGNGANGTVGIGVGAVIKTFTYDRASNTIIVS